MTETEPKTYIALKPCGCLAIAILDIVDKTGNRSHVAKEIAKGIRQGYSFTLMETQAVREMAWKCSEHKKKKGAKL